MNLIYKSNKNFKAQAVGGSIVSAGVSFKAKMLGFTEHLE